LGGGLRAGTDGHGELQTAQHGRHPSGWRGTGERFRAGGAAGWPPSGGRGAAGRPLSGWPVLQDRLGWGRIRTAARPICCCVRTDEEGEGFYLFIMYNIKGENRLTYI